MSSLTKQVKQFYRENIDRILSYREQSGKYRLNPAKVEEWIRSQYTPIRQEACRKLISKVHYFTYGETFDMFFNVVEQMKSLKGKSIYILIQSPDSSVGQSTFLFAMLGYHALLNYLDIPQRDIHFTYDISNDGELVVFDDFSYSGSQITQMIDAFYRKDSTMSVHICLLGASSFANRQMRIKPKLLRNSSWRFDSMGSLPPNFHFYIGKVLERYDEDMTPQEINNVNYFLNPFEMLGKTLVYFDHKIADEISTIMSVLKLGLIIPENYYLEHKITKLNMPSMEPAGERNEIKAVYLIDACEETDRPFVERVQQYISFMFPHKEYYDWIDALPDSKKEQNEYIKKLNLDDDLELEDKLNIMKSLSQLNMKQYFKDRINIDNIPRCPVSFYKQKGILRRERKRSSIGSTRRSIGSRRRSIGSRQRTSTRRSMRRRNTLSRSTRRKSL